MARRQVLSALSYGFAAATLWGGGRERHRMPRSGCRRGRSTRSAPPWSATGTSPATRPYPPRAPEDSLLLASCPAGIPGAAYDTVARCAGHDHSGRCWCGRVSACSGSQCADLRRRGETADQGRRIPARLALCGSCGCGGDPRGVARRPGAAAYQVTCAMLAMGDAARAEDLTVTFAEQFTRPPALATPNSCRTQVRCRLFQR